MNKNIFFFLNFIYHSVQKVWTSSSSIDNPPIWPTLPLFYIFSEPPLLTRRFWEYCRSIIPDKHKNKLMWQSYYFIFKRIKTNVTYFLYKQHFIGNTWLKLNQKESKEKKNIPNQRLAKQRALLLKNPYINKKHCLLPLSIGNSLFLGENLDPPFYNNSHYAEPSTNLD